MNKSKYLLKLIESELLRSSVNSNAIDDHVERFLTTILYNLSNSENRILEKQYFFTPIKKGDESDFMNIICEATNRYHKQQASDMDKLEDKYFEITKDGERGELIGNPNDYNFDLKIGFGIYLLNLNNKT